MEKELVNKESSVKLEAFQMPHKSRWNADASSKNQTASASGTS